MAFIDICAPLHRITILFDAAIPIELLCRGQLAIRVNDINGQFVTYGLDSNYVELEEGNRVLPTMNPEKFMATLLPSYGFAQIGYLVQNVFLYAESVVYSRRLMNMALEPFALNQRVRPSVEKGAKVAIFTQAFNEGDMLLYWERFHGELVGYENLYVLDNGSTDGSCARLNPATNVVKMPAAKVDHIEFAHAHGHFQRFLLMRYEWVVKLDTDELLAVEGGLLERLETLAPGTYLPELALEPLHDKATEAPFRFDGKLCSQRQHFVVGTQGLIRPVLSSVPTSWSSGNHTCFEQVQVLPGFVVVHLRYFDIDFLGAKNAKWSKMQATAREAKTCLQIGALSQLDQDGIDAVTRRELAERFAMARCAPPAWLAATM
jgi:hypothetical protein